MYVKIIAECSKGSILQYFWPSLSYHLSLRSVCLFLSGCFTQVLQEKHVFSKYGSHNLSFTSPGICWHTEFINEYHHLGSICGSMLIKLTLSQLGNFVWFFAVGWFFSKSIFSKHSFRNTISVKQFGSKWKTTFCQSWSVSKMFAKLGYQ